MAGYDFEFYETGTISVTAGQKAFSGNGTAWKIRGCEGALVIVSGAGAVNFVSTLSTDSAGEFRTAWTGPTLADAQYTMWLPSAVAATALANHQRLAEIIASIQGAQPASDNLTALDGLGGDPNALVRFLENGSFDLVKMSDVGIQDPKGTLAKFAALTLAARQIFQTDDTGALKAIALAANKALVTDANKDIQQINLETLGRALLALDTGTTAQFVQGDGTLQSKSDLPVSTAVQTALNAKANTASPTLTGTSTVLALRVGQGTLVGKAQFCNNNGVYIGEIGVGTGTGDTGKMGFYNSINGGWWFNGAVQITGALSKGSGTFLIDHPLDPFNRNLRHGFVEAPRYDLIYRGTVRLTDGRATVDIDAASDMTSGTFEALTTNAVVSSLQNQVGFARLRPGEITGASFEIISEDDQCGDLISWVVIAERNDPFVKSDLEPNTDSNGRFIPEFDKED